jgi:hypothetical protein
MSATCNSVTENNLFIAKISGNAVNWPDGTWFDLPPASKEIK